MTDVSPDPTEPAPTDLLEFPPLPKQSGGPDGPGGAAGSGAPQDGGIRVVPDAEATARLRITLPAQTPTPSTALRPQASWEDTHEEQVALAEPFARIAASPASPSTLPSQLAAMTTATMVIPLPPSMRPGSGLLTTTLPPDQAAQANAARIGEAFRDTIEEIFGVDLDTVDPAELGLSGSGAGRYPDARGAFGEAGASGTWRAESGYEGPGYEGPGYETYGGRPDPGYPDSRYPSADRSGAGYGGPGDSQLPEYPQFPEYPGGPAAPAAPYQPIGFPRPVPAEVFGGVYGVPTQQAPIGGVPESADAFGHNPRGPADSPRHALALRYLGGIFHDSSGESSYLDPEVLDRGWIPSAFGAVPPDAPTEQIARIPSLEPPRGGPVGTIGSGATTGAGRRARDGAPAAGVPAAGLPAQGLSAQGLSAQGLPATGLPPTGVPAAADVTAVLPVQSAPDAALDPRGVRDVHSRAGARGSHNPRRPHGLRGGSAGGRGRDRASADSAAAAGAAPKQDIDNEADGAGRRARALTIAGLCVAAVALLYGIALLVAGGVVGGRVPNGVSVDGVALGGLSPAAARQTLDKQLGPAASSPIELQVGQTPVDLDPAKAGLSLDVAGTVAAAESERTNPFTVIPALFGVGHQIDPVVDVDQPALTAALNSLAASYDSPLVEGAITFVDGQPQVTAPREGRGFDVAAASAAVSSGYLRVAGPIVLPINVLVPRATPEALQNALEQLARPAVSAPITLVADGVQTVLTPEQIGAALKIVPNQDGTMVPSFDGGLLHADLNPAALATEQPGTDAAFTIVGGSPQLVPEKDGVGYAPAALAAAVTRVLTATTASGRTVTVPRGPLPPAFTTADAEALGVQSVLGTATIAVPDAPDRTADATHAVSLVMGSIVQPGAVWSFNKTVGAPIGPNGFAEPAGSAAGDGVDASGADDLVATAVFDAAFRAGMGDTVHHPNAFYLPRYPVGLDAAVVWPGTDLQWTDNGGYPVYVYATYGNGQITVDLLGQNAYDSVNVTVSNRQNVLAATGSAGYGCPAQTAEQGFQVDVTRVLTRGGAQVGTEQYHVTYQPFAGTRCATAGATPTSSGGAPASGGPSTSTGGGSTKSAPTGGGGGGGSGGGSAPPPPTTQPAPAPTDTGVLGGLLH